MAIPSAFRVGLPLALGFLVLGSGLTGAALAAPEMPASMVIVGRIAPGVGMGTVAPRQGDIVLGFATTDGQLLGTGQVFAADGEYMVALTRYASFNGTPLTLELQQGRARYALLRPDGSAVVLRFAGRTLPDRTPLALRGGPKTADLSESETASPQAQRLSRRTDLPCDALADVNEDGRCDEADWQILRRYAGGVTRTVAEP
jgi:hypothetical protein